MYRVNHPIYGEVALKIGQYSSPQSLERINREVSLLKDIDSEYYPKNYDFQVLPPDRFLIIEEYIDSQPLSLRLNDLEVTQLRSIVIKKRNESAESK